uniref:FA complementation group D2 n=1 Tax=Cercocebus atys TaxID=9531 RepID=A0A2K5N028_CERAT
MVSKRRLSKSEDKESLIEDASKMVISLCHPGWSAVVLS